MRTSNSAIQAFKQCRRMYELRYKLNLTPVQSTEALERGLRYHEVVELILMGKEWTCEDPKIRAMCKAFEVYVYPGLKDVVKSCEDWFSYKTKSGHVVLGRTDGLTKGGVAIEHKTSGGLIDGAYRQRLHLDEQILTYMLATDNCGMHYTVCATPTLRQKKDESDDAFFERCLDWYATETEFKISHFMVCCESETLERFKAEQDAVITEMENCKLFYRNPSHCMKWGRLCEYASICMLPNDRIQCADLIGFERREHKYDQAGQTEA